MLGLVRSFQSPAFTAAVRRVLSLPDGHPNGFAILTTNTPCRDHYESWFHAKRE
jgi:hypothetical protein